MADRSRHSERLHEDAGDLCDDADSANNADTDAALEDRGRLIASMELLFFAYRDFTSDADAVLAHYHFGRAHHRVLHFVHRNPGLRVAELLEILRITKQSLSRVLKQLIDEGFICQKASDSDGRARLLHTTEKGCDLAELLIDLQLRRISKALGEAGVQSQSTIEAFLLGMIDDRDHPHVSSLKRSDNV